MDYFEFTFLSDSSLESEIINDLLASELADIGFDSFIPEVDRLLAYIAVGAYDETALNDCLCRFPLAEVHFQYTCQLIKSRDWNEEWEKNYYHPVVIGKKCRIHASFHPEEKEYDYSIVIDPKMAFGTGNHATTYLMLDGLLPLDLKDKAFLDMGCGTAVLAILAAMKGATRVVAIDIDEFAFQNAIENCRLNNITSVEVALGGAEQITRFGTFDYIFANINRLILLNDLHLYVSALNPGGSLYMSGFYLDDIPVIEKECDTVGLLRCSVSEKDNWATFHVKKAIKSGF